MWSFQLDARPRIYEEKQTAIKNAPQFSEVISTLNSREKKLSEDGRYLRSKHTVTYLISCKIKTDQLTRIPLCSHDMRYRLVLKRQASQGR